jgi:hypothetical protein
MTFARPVAESLYLLEGRHGRRYVIYNAATIGDPFDHEPGRWYFLPYPVPLGFRPGPAFASAEAAELAALDRDDAPDLD